MRPDAAPIAIDTRGRRVRQCIAMRHPLCATFTLALALASACSSGDDGVTPFPPGSGGSGGSGGAGGGSVVPAEVGTVPLSDTITAPGLSAPVEVVRDEAGAPHIYAETLPDAAFAQGYMAALDRFVQMDFFRRNASGKLSELLGEAALAQDVEPRLHHLRATAEKTWAAMQASADPLDRDSVAILNAYAAGVNLWVKELQAGKHKLLDELKIAGFTAANVAPWEPADSLSISEFQAFGLSYDVSFELLRTAAFDREKAVFAGSANAEFAQRDGFVSDLVDFRPIRPVYTVDGWGETGRAAAGVGALQPPLRAPEPAPGLAAIVSKVLPTMGNLPAFGPGERGSNNWVVSGAHTTTGHAMAANDTHLSLISPSIFYLVHLNVGDEFDVMGVQFPGAPLVTLGSNRHVAWGATVSQLDVTDVYDEAIAPCAGGYCTSFDGRQVPLVARDETFNLARGGDLANAEVKTLRFYDVPHHGPILPSFDATMGTVAPPGARELSVRYTGHEGGPIFRAVLAINRAKGAAEARDAIESYFAYGRQNWVFADVEGHIGWTQGSRLPLRPAGSKPWLVLPGTGEAEWQGYADVKKMPRAFDPPKGYLVTANADPIGVTDDGDPTNDAQPGGAPLYIGADYDPGARVARVTARIKDVIDTGGKLDADAMSSIQADNVSEFARELKPHFIAAARALADFAADPDCPTAPANCSRPELLGPAAAGAVSARPEVRQFYVGARDLVAGWESLATPSGLEPGADQRKIDDSRATLLVSVFALQLTRLIFVDEMDELVKGVPGFELPLRATGVERVLVRLLNRDESLRTGDVLFDDLKTPGVVETRDVMLARAVSRTLEWAFDHKDLGTDPAAWRWGAIHYVKPQFFIPDPIFDRLDQGAYPRPGGIGTVDVADYGFSDDDFTFRSGASIRFVSELAPDPGPISRNVVPGGQIFEPSSPHFKDQLDLWAQNKTLDLPFRVGDVVASAKREQAKNALGRVRFAP